MEQAVKTIAVVQGAPSAVIQGMFATLVARWQPARIVGVVEESHGEDNQTCGAGMQMDRRTFVKGSVAAAGAVPMPNLVLAGMTRTYTIRR